jgi:hypothetical protein
VRRTPLLVLLAIAALALLPGTASASSSQAMTFEAPGQLLDDAQRDATLDQIRALGVRRIRQLLAWKAVAPNPSARTRPSGVDLTDATAYGVAWGPYDRLVAAAAARGIQVQFTLTGPAPRWATASRDKLGINRPDAREFGRFATAVGRRYGSQVESWSIWNEPNQPQFLTPQFRDGKPYSPRLYRALYRAAVKGLRSDPTNAEDRILLGETSPRGNARIVAPLAFLRETLCLSRSYKKRRGCGKLDADGYAHHAYTTSQGPRFKPANPDDVTIGVLNRLIAALDKAGKAGALDRGIGVYLTEFGTQSYPDKISGVPLSKQAEYRAIAEHIAYVNPRVKLFSQYLMTDDAPVRSKGNDYGGFESGLRLADGQVKPAYEGFRLPLTADDYGTSDVLWGRVRPAAVKTSVQLEARRRGGQWRTLATVATNSTGVFGARTRHLDGQRYRVVWTAPDGTVYTGPPTRAY